MQITLAPVQTEEPRLVLDLSGRTAEDIQYTITVWREVNNIDEWAISEYDDEFRPLLDNDDPEQWANWEEAFEEHGDAILKFWEGALGFTYYQDVAKVSEAFESAYQGEFEYREDWARDFIDACYTLEGPLKNYFDYEKYARDCERRGDNIFIDADNGNVFVFNSPTHHKKN